MLQTLLWSRMICSSTFFKYLLAVLAQTPAAYILMYCNAFSTTFSAVRCFQLRKKVLRLNTPENTITYHNVLCSSPPNFAWALFSVSLGAILTPKRNWKQCLCKIWGWQARVLWYVRVFSGVVNWTLPRIRAQIELSSTFVCDYKVSTSGSSAKNSHLTQGRRMTTIPIPVNLQPRGGGTPLFGVYGYVQLNRVWFSGSWVLNRVYNFTIERLEQGVFLDSKP